MRAAETAGLFLLLIATGVGMFAVAGVLYNIIQIVSP